MPLLSASEAAARFGVSASTAQRRAREAVKTDKRIQRTHVGYVAEEEVWREYIPGPATMGRPRTADQNKGKRRPPRRTP